MSDRTTFSVDQLTADGVEFTVGTEAADVINVAISNKAKRVTGYQFYLADDAAGATPTSVAPAGGIAIGTDGTLIEQTADLSGTVITNSAGIADIDLTNATTTPTFYLVVILPGGNLAISPAITFA